MRSKTDQEGEGRIVGIPSGSDPQFCPVRTLRRWLDAAVLSGGALFRNVDRHGRVAGAALTDQLVMKVVKRCAAAGLDPKLFAAHSLRGRDLRRKPPSMALPSGPS